MRNRFLEATILVNVSKTSMFLILQLVVHLQIVTFIHLQC